MDISQHFSQMQALEKRLRGSAALQEHNHWLTLMRVQAQARIEADRLDQLHVHNQELEAQRHRDRIDEQKKAVINGALSGAMEAMLQTGLKSTDFQNDIMRRTHETHSRIRERLADAQITVLEARALAKIEEAKAEQEHRRKLELQDRVHAQGLERDTAQAHLKRTDTFFTKYCDYIFDLLEREEDERARRAIDELEKKFREEGFRIIEEGFFPDFGTRRA